MKRGLVTHLPWILALAALAGGVEYLLAAVRRAHADLAWRQVESIYEDQLRSENPHLVAQALNTAESAGVISCTKAVWHRPDGVNDAYFDSTFRPECGTVPAYQRIHRDVIAANGQKWGIETTPGTFASLAMIAWPVRLATVLACLLAWGYHVGRMRQQRELSAMRMHHLERLQRVAAQVAHDIRAPVAALRQLSRDLAPERRDLALQAVDRIAEVAHDVLEHERGRAVEAPPVQTIDLAAIVQDVVNERNIALSGALDGRVHFADPPAGSSRFLALGDASVMRRIVSNIVTNALEADAHAPVALEIVHGDGQTAIRIEDHGLGIPDAMRRRILAGERLTTKDDGYGLGLSHAVTTLQSWGGALALADRPGGGTIVTLALVAVSHVGTSTAWDAVLVDDDVWVREAWRDAARERGHKLLTLAHPRDADDALRTVERSTPVFVDLDLAHGERGEDLVHALKELGFANLFLATGYDAQHIGASVKSVVRAVLGKDYPASELARLQS